MAQIKVSMAWETTMTACMKAQEERPASINKVEGNNGGDGVSWED